MGRKSANQDIDAIVSSIREGEVSSADGFSSATALCYFSYALCVCTLPGYLFFTAFDVSNLSVVLGTVVVSALLLTLGYRNVATATRTRLVDAANAGNKGKGGGKEKLKALITSQASNWAFFLNNLAFSLLFVFLAFYVLGGVETSTRYAVSSAVSSFLVWQLSSSN